MDNEAFRSLVNKNRKTTKQIAREAVENEFRKRKRKDTQGYGSDSDSDASRDAGRGRDAHVSRDATEEGKEAQAEPAWKKKTREKTEYRDRAKERREGKNVDYALFDVTTSRDDEKDKKREAELSKFLGGDEEHTHLVKGLDYALAQKVRREEMGEDLDEVLEVALKQGRGDKDGGLSSFKSELGRAMVTYLKKKENPVIVPVKINPSLQKSIQRAELEFSLYSDVRRRRNAWDAPRVSIRAFSGQEDVTVRKATPLDHQLIMTISKKIQAHLLRAKHCAKNAADEKDDANHDTKTTNNGAKSKPPPKDDDSGDDIFENVGTYVPPSTNAIKEATNTESTEPKHPTTDTQETAPKQKKSIFENLITPASKHVTTTAQPRLQIQPQHSNKNVINRDVIGASSDSSQPLERRRGPQTAVLEGFSMNHYSGGYGEEMDVDFGNFEEDERRKNRKDKEESGGGGGGKDDGAGENDF
jgi:IK cytokine